jgi:hypothetical protein
VRQWVIGGQLKRFQDEQHAAIGVASRMASTVSIPAPGILQIGMVLAEHLGGVVM